MKPYHLLTAGLALTACLASCSTPLESTTAMAGDTLKVSTTDTINQWICSSSIKAFYPQSTATPLAQNIQEWIGEQTGADIPEAWTTDKPCWTAAPRNGKRAVRNS